MPINPDILLKFTSPDVSKTFTSFENALIGAQNRDIKEQALAQAREQQPLRNRLIEAQAQTAESAVPSEQAQATARQVEIIQSLSIGAQQIIPDLQAGRTDQVLAKLQRRRSDLIRAGDLTDETDEAIQLARNNPGELLTRSQQAVDLAAQLKTTRTGAASPRAFAPTTDPATGEVSSIVFDPETSGFTRTVIPGAKQLTPSEKSEIEIKETASKERIKLRERRTSEITAELSERNRGAARSSRTLNKALTLAQQASQGLSGAASLQLSRLMPGIDVSDEADLDSSLKQLALEQLQQFKGPTTDFEFGVTQSIAGAIGQSQSSNIARIKSLKRAAWFNQREFDQFDKHVKSGGDPDTFRFNFGEPVRTKKGVFTLQDIQDTGKIENFCSDSI